MKFYEDEYNLAHMVVFKKNPWRIGEGRGGGGGVCYPLGRKGGGWGWC